MLWQFIQSEPGSFILTDRWANVAQVDVWCGGCEGNYRMLKLNYMLIL